MAEHLRRVERGQLRRACPRRSPRRRGQIVLARAKAFAARRAQSIVASPPVVAAPASATMDQPFAIAVGIRAPARRRRTAIVLGAGRGLLASEPVVTIVVTQIGITAFSFTPAVAAIGDHDDGEREETGDDEIRYFHEAPTSVQKRTSIAAMIRRSDFTRSGRQPASEAVALRHSRPARSHRHGRRNREYSRRVDSPLGHR